MKENKREGDSMKKFRIYNSFAMFGDECPMYAATEEDARVAAREFADELAGCFWPRVGETVTIEDSGDKSGGFIHESEWWSRVLDTTNGEEYAAEKEMPASGQISVAELIEMMVADDGPIKIEEVEK
tara:strand:+ start:8811 stop:9191 length:381 start_codon:yes stop_codon:yes gene_type:complete